MLVDTLHTPRLYTAIAVFVYFSFIAAPAHRAESPFGVEDGYCGVDGSCKPQTNWVCSLAEMHEGKCNYDPGGGGCAW
jgi:hypothetical protein